MANSTEEYWSLDGVSLHQFGWSVATVGGGRYDLPPRRGENIVLASRPGAVHRPKVADARVVTLIMWVIGMDPATGNSTGDQTLRWNDSWDFLRRLVWRADGSQVALTRRWRLTVAGVPTLVAATAMAEISDSMSPTMTGRTRADFSMNLLLADPFFYGAPVVTTLAVGVPVTVVNVGHDTAAQTGLFIDLVGPLTNPRVTNSTPAVDVWVQYNGVIPAGVTVRLDIGAATDIRLTDGVALIGMTHGGSPWWMVLGKESNLVTLTAAAGTGHAVMTHSPPYV